MKLSVYGSQSDRFALSAIHQEVADRQSLPSVKTLIESVEQTVIWPSGDYQVYYLDNLREQQSKNLFQIRFKTNTKSRDLTDLFMSVDPVAPHAVLNLTLQFPPRGDRGLSSFVLGLLKEYQKQQRVALEFVLEGYYERAYTRLLKDCFFRESSFSSFAWSERIGRYLHTKERDEDIQEFQRGYIK